MKNLSTHIIESFQEVNENSPTQQTLFQQGYNAAKNHQSIRICPYKEDSESGQKWLAGFKSVNKEIVQEVNVNESVNAYNWKEFTGKKLPEAANTMLTQTGCGEYLRTWDKAYYHDDENDYKNWIVAGKAPGIKVGCKFTLFFHMSARQPHFPEHKFKDDSGCECYSNANSMNLALQGYLTGIMYKGF